MAQKFRKQKKLPGSSPVEPIVVPLQNHAPSVVPLDVLGSYASYATQKRRRKLCMLNRKTKKRCLYNPDAPCMV